MPFLPVRRNTVLLILVLLLTILGAPVASATTMTSVRQSTSADFTIGASTPSSVQAGQTATITASVTSRAANNVLVDVEVFDPAGGRAYQKYIDNQAFAAGQARTFAVIWPVPSSARPGTYTVKIGVFAPGWASLYAWNDLAGQLTVTAAAASVPTSTRIPSPTSTPTTTRTPTPTSLSPTSTATAAPPTVTATATAVPSTATTVLSTATATPAIQPSVQTGASVAPATVVQGGSVTIQASVTSATTTTALVDVEVFDPSGARAFQQFFDNQQLQAGRVATYPVSWVVGTAAPTGTYTVKVGIFRPGWANQLVWNDAAARLTVATALTTPTPSPSPAASPSPVAPSGPKQFGVNVAGAEFGESTLPGTLGTTYVYQTSSTSARYFAGKGQTLVRVPFLWERVQPVAFGPLSAVDIGQLRVMLDTAASAGQVVILDLHNYGRYYGQPLARADAAKLADVWQQLAHEFRGHPAMMGYELMNEPHDLPNGPDGWADLAQAAADAIRSQDTQAWLLVPGYGWQGAWTWPQNNATLDVNDSAGHLLYAAHQYFDRDGSGSYGQAYDADGASPTIGADRLRPFQDWLAARGARGMLTEYGVPGSDARWLTVLDRFLSALDADPRILGGTYWAAGPWWGSYPLSVESSNGQDRPQISVLERYRSHP